MTNSRWCVKEIKSYYTCHGLFFFFRRVFRGHSAAHIHTHKNRYPDIETLMYIDYRVVY